MRQRDTLTRAVFGFGRVEAVFRLSIVLVFSGASPIQGPHAYIYTRICGNDVSPQLPAPLLQKRRRKRKHGAIFCICQPVHHSSHRLLGINVCSIHPTARSRSGYPLWRKDPSEREGDTHQTWVSIYNESAVPAVCIFIRCRPSGLRWFITLIRASPTIQRSYIHQSVISYDQMGSGRSASLETESITPRIRRSRAVASGQVRATWQLSNRDRLGYR